MTAKFKRTVLFTTIVTNVLVFCASCNSAKTSKESLATTTFLPYTDPENKGDWELNPHVSDEFNAKEIDEKKWYIVGKFEGGKPFYKHPDKPNKKVWKGRAPSQFSGKNYRLEGGKLILETRWEPDFPFSPEIRKPVFGEALPYENITTACFIGRNEFKYGYIEIKSKAADGPISSAFWAMGERLEVDFFELFGGTGNPNKKHLDSQLWWSIRDWNKPVRGKPTYTEKKDLGFRVADDFHIYGIEWNENGMKYYVDGKLFSEVTAEEVTAWAKKNRTKITLPENYNGYVADRPISLWLDQEAFPWHDVPKSKEELEAKSPEHLKNDGVLDYEIEYIRVWQKR
ncbi:family 16 glycosylhydrolase [Flavivirga rizhaonensis]|uniref:Glycosyl hydrolase family protein n=1 Tax=Flavivirga rizhaonensis TaxID=2559571 RepID=A0A4V3P4L1_9FLAO|nr:family 16 glycosylhydrolase [Flavivirga rizhaonensis]TGV01884.1 glycosyl hydrolase family protein [Flavivirga rizhaonensis]